MSEFREALRRAVDSPAVESTPKPRAGEHTFTDVAIAHAKELDVLRNALTAILPIAESYLANAPGHPDNAKLEDARAALAKHGR